MWYLTDLARFKAERQGLETLGSTVNWLTSLGWRIDDKMRLIFDADIAVGQRVFPVYLRFPAQFPHTPPSVWPRGDDSRWSNHQFGAGGELCLEYGPDNWTSDMTGVQMIESAHRLLEGENLPSGERGVVASRHLDSLGQSIRGELSRLLVTRELAAFLSSVPLGTKLTGNFISLFRKPGAFTYLIDRITLEDGSVWRDPTVPDSLGYETFERSVALLRIPPTAALPSTDSAEVYYADCAAMGFTSDERTVVVLRGADVFGFIGIKDICFKLTTIPPETLKPRLDNAHQSLEQKSVALVGCGSVGSKLATMLARSGVVRFVLVDPDVLMPDNMVRHDLDWRDIGAHKVDALARRLKNVQPAADIRLRRQKLAGQESGGDADSVLSTLAECDLIIDATANHEALNLISAVATRSKKPVLWAKVFGGGVGGIIARSRPGIEPSPQWMRRAIDNWFRERSALPPEALVDYGAPRGEGDPFIADDADVTAIAAPAARLAIDTLLSRDPSDFPYSAYAIGLAAGLVFSQPFDTHPIEIGTPPAEAEAMSLSTEDAGEEFAMIAKLFEQK